MPIRCSGSPAPGFCSPSACGAETRPCARRGLALVALTVVKLFLFDMRALDGLWRVASFLGLGLSLVAVAGVYRRFVPPPVRRTRQGAPP